MDLTVKFLVFLVPKQKHLWFQCLEVKIHFFYKKMLPPFYNNCISESATTNMEKGVVRIGIYEFIFIAPISTTTYNSSGHICTTLHVLQVYSTLQ
jgi:hypothetical protein